MDKLEGALTLARARVSQDQHPNRENIEKIAVHDLARGQKELEGSREPLDYHRRVYRRQHQRHAVLVARLDEQCSGLLHCLADDDQGRFEGHQPGDPRRHRVGGKCREVLRLGEPNDLRAAGFDVLQEPGEG